MIKPITAVGALACLALCGCPTVDLGDQPPDIGVCNPTKGYAYFQTDIVPKYLKLADMTNGCARSTMCHLNAHGAAFNVSDPTSAANYRVAQQYLDCGAPRQSWLLTKPLSGEDSHGGGDLFDSNSSEYSTFMGWFQ